MKDYIDPKKYWLGILESHNNDFEKVKQIILRDRVSFGVVAALLLAINSSGIITVQNTELENIQLLTVLIHTISGMFALSCIWISMQQYLKINMLSPKNAMEYKLLMKWYDEPVTLLTLSILTLPIALVFNIYIAYGFKVFFYSSCAILIFYLYSIVIVFKSALRYHHVIKNN